MPISSAGIKCSRIQLKSDQMTWFYFHAAAPCCADAPPTFDSQFSFLYLLFNQSISLEDAFRFFKGKVLWRNYDIGLDDLFRIQRFSVLLYG